MKKYGSFDKRILNDLGSASNETKQYHEANARSEASSLVNKYRNSPVYLKILSMALADQANKVYSSHIAELEASRPENQREEQIKREVTERVMRQLSGGYDE